MDSSYLLLANLAQQVEIPRDGILSRTLYQDEHVKVVLFGFDQGQELSEHTASTPALLYFVQGQAALTLGSDQHTASAGAWVYMPPNLPHSVAAKTPVVMLLILLRQQETQSKGRKCLAANRNHMLVP